MTSPRLSQRILESMSQRPGGLRLRRALGTFKRGVVMPPIHELTRMRAWGVRGYFLWERWAAEMERAAYDLTPLPKGGEAVPLWYLTGSKYWYQTAFCAWTFGRHTGRPVHLRLVDDGTLAAPHIRALERIFGDVHVVEHRAARENLAKRLPPEKFPVLTQRWREYVHIRKLIDIHLGSTGKKLVLDSDMLFFGAPNELTAWCDSDDRRILHMIDCDESYGYDRNVLQELAGAPLPVKLNVGICGMESSEIDWELLEHWCATLLRRFGMSYYLEQALVAMMAARYGRVAMPASQYITLPPKSAPRDALPVLHHYVAESKPLYFGWGWRRARAQTVTAPNA